MLAVSTPWWSRFMVGLCRKLGLEFLEASDGHAERLLHHDHVDSHAVTLPPRRRTRNRHQSG